MNTFTKTFETVRGAGNHYRIGFGRMDRVEAIDVYDQSPSTSRNGGYRVEFEVNGVPRASSSHNGSLGLDIMDADDVTAPASSATTPRPDMPDQRQQGCQKRPEGDHQSHQTSAATPNRDQSDSAGTMGQAQVTRY